MTEHIFKGFYENSIKTKKTVEVLELIGEIKKMTINLFFVFWFCFSFIFWLYEFPLKIKIGTKENSNEKFELDFLDFLEKLSSFLVQGISFSKALNKIFFKIEPYDKNYLNQGKENFLLSYQKFIKPSNSKTEQEFQNEFLELNFAYEISKISGIPLRKLINELIENYKFNLEQKKLINKNIASSKSSIKLLSYLPIIGLLFGFLTGVNILELFFTTLYGFICLILGISFYLLGFFTTRKMINSLKPNFSKENQVNWIFRVMRTCLDGSISIQRSIKLISQIHYDSEIKKEFSQIYENLQKGKSWSESWEKFEHYNIIKLGFQESYEKGLTSKQYCDDLLFKSKVQKEDLMNQKAEKLGVKILIPLGLCYLPSFIFFTIIPIILINSQSLTI